jgi:ABC-type antimicrobial peptide transport system permease subunit
MAFMVRTAGDAAGLEPQVRKVMRELSPDLPIYSVATMSTRLGAVVSAQRLSGLLLSAFAGLALLLAIIGLYGVLSYRVSQRTREIGIRMALGAQRPAVLGLIIGQGLRLTALGLVLGLAAAAATTRVFAGLLYQTAPTDPVSFFAAAVVLVGAALAACWLPARRATRVDPIDALRAE